MQTKRATLLMTLLFGVLLLAGCGPRPGAADQSAEASSTMKVNLPAIYIDFDDQGVATMGGMNLSQAGLLLGQKLPNFRLGPDIINEMKKLDIQHIQLINKPTGLDILVNGLRVPSLAWDPEVLTNLRALFANLGVDLGSAGALVPMLGSVDAGFVLRFPVADDKVAIPLTNPNAEKIAAEARAAAQEYVESGGEIPAISFSVDYKPDGTWTVQGQNAAQWEEILPIGWEAFNLDPELIQGAVDTGIRTLTVKTAEDGVHIVVNDQPLPTVTWDNGELNNTLELIKQAGIIDVVASDNPQISGVLDIVESVVPTVQSADFSMTVRFPQP